MAPGEGTGGRLHGCVLPKRSRVSESAAGAEENPKCMRFIARGYVLPGRVDMCGSGTDACVFFLMCPLWYGVHLNSALETLAERRKAQGFKSRG
jgi:hypothetical protein